MGVSLIFEVFPSVYLSGDMETPHLSCLTLNWEALNIV